MLNGIMQKLFSAFISQKRVIGWVAAAVMAIVAVVTGLRFAEVKQAICDAPALVETTPNVPAVVPPSPAVAPTGK